MEHAEQSDVCAQVLWVTGEFEQRLGAGAE
jgi:hypothetical protein